MPLLVIVVRALEGLLEVSLMACSPIGREQLRDHVSDTEVMDTSSIMETSGRCW